MNAKSNKMNINTAHPFLLKDQFKHRTKEWNCYKKEVILFFATLLEKMRDFSDASDRPASMAALKILIVDDDEDDRHLLEEAITSIEPLLKIDIATNGMEMIERLNKETLPEIIFLDLNMPGKNGKECLAEIREHKSWKKIPVVIYSTSANRNDIFDTYNGGANLYLLKPTSFLALIGMIRRTFTFDWEQMDQLSPNDFLLMHTTAI